MAASLPPGFPTGFPPPSVTPLGASTPGTAGTVIPKLAAQARHINFADILQNLHSATQRGSDGTPATLSGQATLRGVGTTLLPPLALGVSQTLSGGASCPAKTSSKAQNQAQRATPKTRKR